VTDARTELKTAVEALLPAREANELAALSEREIDGLVRHLFMEGGEWSIGNRLPREKWPAKPRMKEELQRVASAAVALEKALASMHGPAASMFGRLDVSIMRARTLKLVALYSAEQPVETIEPPVQRTGALDPQVRLSLLAANIFVFVTGDLPSRRTKEEGGKAYGPFYDFLCAVFRARGISGSAENHARRAIKLMEKKPRQKRK
jgi:hypothetical protein